MFSAIKLMTEELQFELFNDLCFLFLLCISAYCLKSRIIELSDCLVSMVGDYGWMRELITA